ncbi:hypothetical protein [Spongiactinospora sp. TRM90649]|uniref:hypothetical protein n=1 Tax=Spongiactinospora sp. TRM90649 TaxID=3031114 RepID=UPI0023F9457F|nr:hypothetical protein [Spongiactinospora sp. TRM90649]MDF5757595.1 hypothetical protein [Spongiactinospora sp. TRM90649]
MTHPLRLGRAEALRDRHPELRASVVVDPRPEDGPATIRTALAAWAAADPEGTHHLVLQDDVVLCAGFLDRLTAAITRFPTVALSLFTEWGSATSHHLRLVSLFGASWAEVIDDYVPSVALVLPTAIARDFGDMAGGPPQAAQDDVALAGFLRARGVRTLCGIPTLAEHDGQESLAGNDAFGPRRSVCFQDDVLGTVADTVVGGSFGAAWRLPVISRMVVPPRLTVGIRAGATAPWEVLDADAAFRRLGVDPAEAGRLSAARVADLHDGPNGHGSGFAAHLLETAWLAAFAAGAVLAGPAPAVRVHPPAGPPDLATALASPVVRRAFGTLPQGVLHATGDRRAPHDHDLDDDLGSLMLEAVRTGYQRVTGPQTATA